MEFLSPESSEIILYEMGSYQSVDGSCAEKSENVPSFLNKVGTTLIVLERQLNMLTGLIETLDQLEALLEKT